MKKSLALSLSVLIGSSIPLMAQANASKPQLPADVYDAKTSYLLPENLIDFPLEFKNIKHIRKLAYTDEGAVILPSFVAHLRDRTDYFTPIPFTSLENEHKSKIEDANVVQAPEKLHAMVGSYIGERSEFKRRKLIKDIDQEASNYKFDLSSIEGNRYFFPIKIKGSYPFDFDTMSKTVVLDSGLRCIGDKSYVRVRSASSIETHNYDDLTKKYAFGRRNVRDIIAVPTRGLEPYLNGAMEKRTNCSVTLNFNDEGRAEAFDELMSSKPSVAFAVVNITGDVTTGNGYSATLHAKVDGILFLEHLVEDSFGSMSKFRFVESIGFEDNTVDPGYMDNIVFKTATEKMSISDKENDRINKSYISSKEAYIVSGTDRSDVRTFIQFDVENKKAKVLSLGLPHKGKQYIGRLDYNLDIVNGVWTMSLDKIISGGIIKVPEKIFMEINKYTQGFEMNGYCGINHCFEAGLPNFSIEKYRRIVDWDEMDRQAASQLN